MSVTQPPSRPGVEVDNPNAELHRKEIARVVNRINHGQMSCTLFVTLTANVATTTVTDSRISAQTCASFCPTTAHAATAIATLYAVCTNGQMVINHANNAQTDRVFTVGLIG